MCAMLPYHYVLWAASQARCQVDASHKCCWLSSVASGANTARIHARCACIGRCFTHAALWDRGLVAEVGAAARRHRPVHTAYSPPGSSFKPDVAGRACISGGDRIAADEQGSRGHGLIREEQAAEAEGGEPHKSPWLPRHHATSPPQPLDRSIAVASSAHDCWPHLCTTHVTVDDA